MTSTTKKIKFRSNFERDVYNKAINEGKRLDYEKERLAYSIDHIYIPDMSLSSGILVELKGRFFPTDQRKLLAVRSAHPTRDIRILLQRAKVPVRRGSKMTMEQWCIKHGFDYAIGSIPLEWFD